ncbi:MAG: chemotaxis protein CheW [Candidatus Melainabacteria bacterium GWF2_37_15]|nr:MAG: chemotaxis protein CheW [Candidatus Melainabacteria bacterium GWF2_37_15]
MQIQDGKHLTFCLGKEDYGIPILQVREIIGMMDITHVPKTPSYIKGVINLRGKIIPIMDLRLKFNMNPAEYTERTCIIVVEVNVNQIKKPMGLVVDMVSEVVNIDKDEIEEALDYGAKVEGDFLTGLGKVKDKVVMLLEIEKIFDNNDFSIVFEEAKV